MTKTARTGLYLAGIDEAVADELAHLNTPTTLRVVAEYGALARHADEMLRQVVGNARGNGATWKAIGDSLGVTAQAAQQRFGGGK
jgi:hypothetical protein